MSLQDCKDDLFKIESESVVLEPDRGKQSDEDMAVDVPTRPDIPILADINAAVTADTESQEILDHLSRSSTAHFKSQQVNDPELDADQKREIASKVLAENPSKFLSQFGRHLEEKHLNYFTRMLKEEDYELAFHLKELTRFHSKEKKHVDVKNRRFQALKKLQDGSTYFTETVMKARNPLLYEQLIGQFLSEDEIFVRRQESVRANSTLVGVLLAQIDRDQTNQLHQLQKDNEEGAVEEVESSEEDSEPEMVTDDDASSSSSENDSGCKVKKMKKKPLTSSEKELLRTEFYSHMYNSFLDGKDEEFDYSLVDFNPDCECLAVRAQDEEEKYFDSETPEEDVAFTKPTIDDDMEEDELDVFMNNLQPDLTPSDLCAKIEEHAVL